MVLNRDSIRNGFVKNMVREAEHLGLVRTLSDEERRASRAAAMAQCPCDDIWVFGYGSLMWNPAFHYERDLHARLYGYHRAFCLWTPIGRGSPDRPGLMLGLERGGSVNGVALKLHRDRAEEELDIVWAREMVTGSYRPTWVRLTTPEGPIHAIAFVIDRDTPRYAGKLPFEETARAIATASGKLGPCWEYLENTVASLDRIGIADCTMHNLLKRVRDIRAGMPAADS